MHALKEVLRTMEFQLDYSWTLQELSDLTHLSPSRFSALFQQAVGTSPHHYLIQLRLTHAVHLLETTDQKIIEIAESCGFRNLSNFNRLFKQHVGASPSEIRERAYAGTPIIPSTSKPRNSKIVSLLDRITVDGCQWKRYLKYIPPHDAAGWRVGVKA